MDKAAMREAMLKPRVLKAFLEKYNNSRLPTDRIAMNVLGELGVPPDSASETHALILSGAREVGFLRDVKNSTYVDLDSQLFHTMDGLSDSDELDEDGDRKEEDAGREVSPPAPQQNRENNRVFITHGKNRQIVTQLKELLTFGKLVPVVAEDHETVSKPVPDKVLDEMRTCYAAIIHVGNETRVLDTDGNEHTFLNQNVLIEIGAAMALYARRFILLVEKGVSLPSNLQGLYEVRYEGDRLDYDATMKLLRAFNDFKN